MNEEPNKIRVLIAEDQKVFQLGIQKMFERSPAISIVGIVSNGREVLEQIEPLMPDVVILDALMPIMDGLETAEQLTQTYPNVKTIFISGSVEYERIDSALKAGASGYLKKETLELDLIPAIMAVNRDNVYFSPEIVPIVQEGARGSNLAASFFQTQPKQPKLRRESVVEICLAKEIISKWRSDSELKIDITPRQAMDALQLSLVKEKLITVPPANNWQLKTISEKLNRFIKVIEKAYSERSFFSSQLLEKAQKQIDSWFDEEVETKIYTSTRELRLLAVDRLDKIIAPYWQNASPENLVFFFTELSKQLSAHRQQYQQNSMKFLNQSNNAFNSLAVCKKKVDENQEKLLEQKHWCESAFRAIILGFDSKLESEVHDAMAQILAHLILSSQFYGDAALKTNNLLKEIEGSLLRRLKPTLESLELKTEIEVWLGHRLNQWGSSPSITSNTIEEKLLSKIALPFEEQILSN